MTTGVTIPCETPTCFDLAHAAELYSALTGVLAGFTFTVIVFLVQSFRSRPDSDEGRLLDALVVFVVAFVAASEATFLFATVAAEDAAATRVLVENLNAVAVGVVLVVCLTYGVVLLLHRFRLYGTTAIAARLFRYVFPVLLLIYSTVIVWYFVTAPRGVSFRWSAWFPAQLAVLALGVATSVSAAAPPWVTRLLDRLDGRVRRWVVRGGRGAPAGELTYAIVGGAVAVILAAAVVAGVMQYLPPRIVPDPWIGFVGLLIITLSVFVYTVALRRVQEAAERIDTSRSDLAALEGG